MEWISGALAYMPWVLSQPWFQGLVALLAAAGGAGFGWCIWRIKRLQAQLADHQDRARIKAELEAKTTSLKRYTSSIKALNAHIRAFYGPPLGWKAFDRSLLVAIVYPLWLFIFAWVTGGVGNVGDLRIMPFLETEERIIISAALILISIIISLYFFYIKYFQLKIELLFKFNNIINKKNYLIISNILYTTMIFTVVLLSVYLSVFYFGKLSYIAAMTFSMTYCLGVAITLSRVGFSHIAGICSILISAAGAISGMFVGNYADIITFQVLRNVVLIITFLTILPAINAIFDWLSWAFTRYFLEKAKATQSGLGKLLVLAGHVVADFIAALLCLAGLAFTMGLALEGMNWGFVKLSWPQFDWTQQLYIAVHQPLTAGLAVTGMLLSTLVPTFIHLVVGLWGVFAVSTPDIKAAAAKISDNMSTGDRQSVAHTLLWHRDFKLAPAIIATCAIMGLPLLAIWHWHIPVAQWLTWLALSGAKLVPAP